MLHSGEMTVLERQQALQQQEQQLQGRYFGDNNSNLLQFAMQTQQQQQHFPGMGLLADDSVIREFVNRSMKLDPGLDSGWPDFQMVGAGFGLGGFGSNIGFDGLVDHSLSRTTSCQLPESPSLGLGGKKRKTQNPKVAEEVREKKMKGESEGESKVTEQNSSNSNNKEASGDSVKKNSKAASEAQKQDYIHVRARRGQATDSHSLAERVRREKISERMKYLQDLVPGCNKITGKAGMLDEIINYVQSLQRQVEFLSMKLAAVNPRLDFNIENIFGKEIFSASTAGFPIGTSAEMANCPTYLPMNSLQQLVSSCGMDMPMSSSDMALQRSRSLPISDAFIDASCFHQAPPASSGWDTEIPNIYNVEFNPGRPTTTFQAQSFTGVLEANNLKMEM